MKFYEYWIKKYINIKLNLNKIHKLLNLYGFENKKKFIINNFIKLKIFNIKKNNEIYIFFFKKKKINFKVNILNKYKNKIKYLFINKLFIENKYKKNKIFNIFKIKINNKKYYILKHKKNIICKVIKFLNISLPYNRIDCNNIINISKEICILLKKKFIYKNIKLNIKNKKNIKFNLKIKSFNNINYFHNYKYIIINKINFNNFKTPNYIIKTLKYMDIKINNNILDIINYFIIKFGQLIICLDFKKIKNNRLYLNIKKKKFILKYKKKNILNNFIYYNNFFLPSKNTKKIILISILFTTNFIKKYFIKKKSNSIIQYINNINKKNQDISLKEISLLLKSTYKSKIILFKTKKNKNFKKQNKIKLEYYFIYKKIGLNIKKNIILNILKNIQYKIIKKKKYVLLYKHKYRHDLNIKEDIIEEIVKFYGYNKIPNLPIINKLIIKKNNNKFDKINNIKTFLVNIGYKEVINFHLTNKKNENIILTNKKHIKLINPLSKKISILRTSLIPGIINNINYNIKRQNNNIKFFEIGTCYNLIKNIIIQKTKITAIICGFKYFNNWNIKNTYFDFYDLKGDLELLFKKQKKSKFIEFKKSNYLFLDKQQNSNIFFKNKKIGFIGKLNNIKTNIDIKYPIFLFELNIDKILYPKKTKIFNISKYPENKRDITLIINNNISINKIIKKCININKNIIKKINIINIYTNKLLQHNNKKNITLSLIIQSNKKTLNEKEINKIILQCKKLLKSKFNALIDEQIKIFMTKKN